MTTPGTVCISFKGIPLATGLLIVSQIKCLGICVSRVDSKKLRIINLKSFLKKTTTTDKKGIQTHPSAPQVAHLKNWSRNAPPSVFNNWNTGILPKKALNPISSNAPKMVKFLAL